MKSEWEFRFTTHGFRFDREYKYRAEIDKKVSIGNRDPQSISPLIRITPSDHEPFPNTDQIGSLYVLIPYSPEETRDLAFYCASTVAERISFTHGDFRLSSALIICKRIPETPEEELEIGDAEYGAEVHLEEVISPEKFDSDSLQSAPIAHGKRALIAQFNEAKRIERPISKFVAFFKVIESLTHAANERRELKTVLLGSDELRRIYNELPCNIDFDSFVERAINARHNCAHLKINKDFGYTPLNSAVKLEVEPLLPAIEMLAYAAINQWPDANV